MRGLMLFLGAIMVMALGFWSYQENYKTRDEISEVRGEVSRIIYPLPEILPITNPIDINNYTPLPTDEDPL